MNDRYLFKAKGQTDGKWHTGLLAEVREGVCVIYESARFCWICDPETLCQCTGMKDKAENLIWENDLVLTPKEDGYSLIYWNDTEARWEMYNEAEKIVLDFDNYWANEIEVVGNRLAIQYIMEESEEKKDGI